jgi:hypothetical protein
MQAVWAQGPVTAIRGCSSQKEFNEFLRSARSRKPTKDTKVHEGLKSETSVRPLSSVELSARFEESDAGVV